MDDLLGIARLIAQWHVDQAVGACGAVSDLAVSPNYGAVVDAYAWVVERVLQAFHDC